MVSTRTANGSAGAGAGPSTPGKRRLQFNEKLVGKGHATEALLKKLKALHGELAGFDQDEVDVGSLAGVRKELISTSLTLHKDRGVKAYAACCLADILKLYAPDAPYTQNELKDIFDFFFRQLVSGLKGSDAPYYEQYFYLLDSLAKCKSVVLVCDLPNADDLMIEAFRGFFSLVKNNLVKNVEMAMSDILCALIDECTNLPADVLDIIMAQFKEKNPVYSILTTAKGMELPGYRLAVDVCNSRADRLQRHVCQYFTDIIIQSSQDDELDDLRKAHDLIRELNRAAPGLLHSVVPQLEDQLRVDDPVLRVMATQTLGGMFGDKNGADLARRHPHTWAFWLSRKMDKAAQVRVALVDAAHDVLVGHPELRKDVADMLVMKLEDPDERVRVAVCKAYARLDFENALHHVETEHLHKLAERGKDKKAAVRAEAFGALGKLYKVALPEMCVSSSENNNVAAINHFAWIPEKILHLLPATQETRASAEHTLAELILPLPSKGEDEVGWTERLLLAMRFMDEDAINTLLSVSNLKLQRPTVYERFIDICVEFNGGTMDANEQLTKKKLALVIQRIAGMFPDRAKATEDLNEFAKANEQRLYQLFRKCADPASDLKTLAKSTAEFGRRVEQALAGAGETLRRLVRLASLWVANTASVPTLLAKLRLKVPARNAPRVSVADAAAQDAQDNARRVFRALCKWCPPALKQHSAEFTKALMEDKHPLLCEMALQALASLAVMDASLAPSDKRFVDRLVKYSQDKNARHAKFAARILAKLDDKTDKCQNVVKSIANGLRKANKELVVSHIAALTQVAKYAPETFEAHSEPIIEFVVQQVLMQPCENEDEMDVEDEWAEDDDLPPLARAKLISLKMCRNRSIAQAGTETAMDVTTPVLKMLFSILENNGSVKDDVKTRMRFQAAICLLQLAGIPAYAAEIVPQFALLALSVQDPCYNVRSGFLNKFTSLAYKLEYRFNLIPFLTAVDPESDIRQKARQYVQINCGRLTPGARVAHFEMIFIRFLHILAHHPDFTSQETKTLKDMAKYLEFYVDTICNADNVALIYCLALRAKSVRDAESHTASEVRLSRLVGYISPSDAGRRTCTS
ncbi:hypothetical protein AURDEDRAFT_71387 [Auricularia subglabra TFB-10046 SS5]|nr:hypothetical protein AURDEDRAFT_71387 [Auricularia subglabra TFB-10046 SS5]